MEGHSEFEGLLRCVYLILVVLFAFTYGISYGINQPAYFVIGADQFKGIQIYDVIQDDQQHYWIATNKGLYVYDYYDFRKVNCTAAKSEEYFSFVKSQDGTIYCHNLNGQLFVIQEGKIALFYELKKGEKRPDLWLTIAPDGKLLIHGATLLSFDPQAEIERFKLTNRYVGKTFQTRKGVVLSHISNTDSVISYANGVFSKEQMKIEGGKSENTAFRFFNIADQTYAVDLTTHRVFEFNETDLTLSLSSSPSTCFSEGHVSRIYQDGPMIWAAGTLPGVYYQSTLDEPGEVWYKERFISDVYRDEEGNLLLSTFNHGIIVIPDLNVSDVIDPFKEDPIVTVFHNQQGVLMGSSLGKIYLYAGDQLRLLSDEGTRPINGIYGNSNSDGIVFDDGVIKLMNLNSGDIQKVKDFSLKDVVVIDSNHFMLGTNIGLLKWDGDQTAYRAVEQNSELSEARIYAMAYDKVGKEIYVASSEGLISWNLKGESQQITYEELPLFASYVTAYKSRFYVIKPGVGILVYKDRALEQVIKPKLSSEVLAINKLMVRDEFMIASTPLGLFQLNEKGEVMKSYHAHFGFSAEHIIDFTLDDQGIWVSHAGGVQLIRSEDYELREIPEVEFDRITVNDEEINFATQSAFTYSQNKIGFTLAVKTLRDQELIRYYYRLEGYDNEWHTAKFKDHKINYSALAPGEYTFVVKSEFEGSFGKEISYQFSIAGPYYTSWWFVLMAAIVFVLIVLLIYKRQLRMQQGKSRQLNELNASRLTAIQSQMNPHFIFNSLNSIQDLVLKGDVENSYTYITTFSDLVRRTLNYSEKDLIDFEKEIKLLEIYLSLEKLRFKKDFTYTIEVEGVEDIAIPPLLIQPFVENALIHGLLHKEGTKMLKISFEQKESSLICTIEDNGIGRKQSQEIRKRQRSDHESFSGKAIKKRFEILSEVYKGAFHAEYIDLTKGDQAIGTRVVLYIPYRQKY